MGGQYKQLPVPKDVNLNQNKPPKLEEKTSESIQMIQQNVQNTPTPTPELYQSMDLVQVLTMKITQKLQSKDEEQCKLELLEEGYPPKLIDKLMEIGHLIATSKEEDVEKEKDKELLHKARNSVVLEENKKENQSVVKGDNTIKRNVLPSRSLREQKNEHPQNEEKKEQKVNGDKKVEVDMVENGDTAILAVNDHKENKVEN